MNTLNDLVARYNAGVDEVTRIDDHTLIERHENNMITVYVRADGDDFTEWTEKADQARRQAGLAHDPVVGWFVKDPTKPHVADGDFVTEYDPASQTLVPYISVTKNNEHDFRKAAIAAFSLVGEAHISMKRTGQMPSDPHIWYRNGSQALDDLVYRGTGGIC